MVINTCVCEKFI